MINLTGAEGVSVQVREGLVGELCEAAGIAVVVVEADWNIEEVVTCFLIGDMRGEIGEKQPESGSCSEGTRQGVIGVGVKGSR